jgi:hypothetical protein
MLLWERDGKRGYLFEDGALRTIAEPYYALLKLSQTPADEVVETFQRQLSRMNVTERREAFGSSERTRFSLDEQAQLLLGQFTGGFTGEAWTQKQRGSGVKKRLKRHRDPAVTEAKEVLNPTKLKDASIQGTHRGLWTRIGEMLRGTDLVPVSEVKELQGSLDRVGPALTKAFSDLLEAPLSSEPQAVKEFNACFSEFVKELTHLFKGKKPSWAMATAMLALVDPVEHYCVHRGSLQQQAKWMKQAAVRSDKPNALDYARARAFAKKVSGRLTELGVLPLDLLDVYDFIRTTTTPTAKKQLEVIGIIPTSQTAPANDVSQDAAEEDGAASDRGTDETATEDEAAEDEAAEDEAA